VPTATDIKRSSEGCEELDYTVVSAFPSTGVLDLISNKLRRQGWTAVRLIDRTGVRHPGVFKAPGKWEHFKIVTGATTYVRAEQWTNNAGDTVSYDFWHYGPDLQQLLVYGRYCRSEYIEQHRCVLGPPKPHDEKAYSLALTIIRIERVEKDFKVFVKVENNGTKPVLVGLNGRLSDGSPELWVLGLEEEDLGEWGAVDAVCAEHDPLDWITLKPGDDAESWALAVDFPEPNHRFAKCRRRIAHLHGKIRASVRYYPGVCEIEDSFGAKDKYFATSDPVELPLP
jgi:hypothetical protein